MLKGPLLGLDWGKKKVGYATADALGIGATPRGHFKRSAKAPAWQLDATDRSHLIKLIEDYEPAEIVLGLPLNADGSESASSTGARKLATLLEAEFKLPVHLIDERLSSWESRQSSDDDAAAAALVLTDFLAQNNRKSL